MTPDDVAAMHCPDLNPNCPVAELRAALEQAWEQRDEWKESHNHWRNEFKAVCARAELAEAEVGRLREQSENRADRCAYYAEELDKAEAELAAERQAWHPHSAVMPLRLAKAEAALVRVRALCDAVNPDSTIGLPFVHRVRAAIEGDQQ